MQKIENYSLEIGNEIAKATGREYSLIMCNLENFKAVNDTYGHEVGNTVLKHFVNQIIFFVLAERSL